MPVALPPSKLRSVVTQLELGTAYDDIVRRAGVSKRSIKRIKHNLVHYRSANCPKAEKQGGPRKMTVEMEEVCYIVDGLTLVAQTILERETFQICG